MKLFERIREISAQQRVSLSEMARTLDMTPQTFNGYLNSKREDNLWPLLPRILEAFPQIRREWLYFDEGSITEAVPLPGGTGLSIPAPSSMATGIQSIAPGMVAATSEALSNPLVQRIVELEQALRAKDEELTEANRLNRRLTNRLLIEGAGDKPDAQSSDRKAAGQ